MKRLATYTALVFATLTVLAILWVFRQVIVLFFFSLAVAAAARPMVDALIQKGVNRAVSLLIVYAVMFLIIGGLLILIGQPLLAELEALSDSVATTYDRMWRSWPEGTQLQQSIIGQLPPPQDLYEIITGEQGLAFAQAFLGVTVSSFTAVGNFFAIIILSIYWSIDRIHFERLWLSLLPVDTRARAREVWRDIENGVGAYIRSEVAQSLLAGILLGAGFFWMGLPYPILIALISALVWLVPWLGAVLALIPVMIVGFSTDLTLGLIATGYTVVVLLIMELVIEPRLFSRGKLSSLLVVLLMIALADALGLVGIILAPPLAAAIQLLFRHFILPGPTKTRDESVQRIADLDQKLIGVQELVAGDVENLAPESVNLLERLTTLVTNAKKIVAEQERAVGS